MYTAKQREIYGESTGIWCILILGDAMAKTTIEFSETAISQLDQLAGTLHATKAEILRNALSLYAYVVYQLQGAPDRMLGIVNESQGDSKVEKLLAVPGVQMASANNRVA